MKYFKGKSWKKGETLRGLILKLHTRSAMWVMIMALVAAIITGYVVLHGGSDDVTHLDRTEVENRYYASEGTNDAELIVQEAEKDADAVHQAASADRDDIAGMQEELDEMAASLKEGKDLLDALYEAFGESDAADEELLSRIQTLKTHVGDLTGKIGQTEKTLQTVRKEEGQDAGNAELSELLSRVEELKKDRDKTAGTVEEIVKSVQSVQGFDTDAALRDITAELLNCMNSEVEEEMTRLTDALKTEIDRKMDDFLNSAKKQAEEGKAGTDGNVTEELIASVASLEQQIAALKQQNEELLSAIAAMQNAPVQTVSYAAGEAAEETIVENVGLTELTDAEKQQFMEAMIDAQIMNADEFREAYSRKVFADDVDLMLTQEAFP